MGLLSSCWFLTAVGSFIAEHGSRARGLWSLQHVGSVVAAPRLLSTGSVVLANGLSCSTACGVFPDQGSNPCLLPLAGGFLIAEPPRKSILNILNGGGFLVLLNCGTCCADCHQGHKSVFLPLYLDAVSCLKWAWSSPKAGGPAVWCNQQGSNRKKASWARFTHRFLVRKSLIYLKSY